MAVVLNQLLRVEETFILRRKSKAAEAG